MSMDATDSRSRCRHSQETPPRNVPLAVSPWDETRLGAAPCAGMRPSYLGVHQRCGGNWSRLFQNDATPGPSPNDVARLMARWLALNLTASDRRWGGKTSSHHTFGTIPSILPPRKRGPKTLEDVSRAVAHDSRYWTPPPEYQAFRKKLDPTRGTSPVKRRRPACHRSPSPGRANVAPPPTPNTNARSARRLMHESVSIRPNSAGAGKTGALPASGAHSHPQLDPARPLRREVKQPPLRSMWAPRHRDARPSNGPRAHWSRPEQPYRVSRPQPPSAASGCPGGGATGPVDGKAGPTTAVAAPPAARLEQVSKEWMEGGVSSADE